MTDDVTPEVTEVTAAGACSGTCAGMGLGMRVLAYSVLATVVAGNIALWAKPELALLIPVTESQPEVGPGLPGHCCHSMSSCAHSCSAGGDPASCSAAACSADSCPLTGDADFAAMLSNALTDGAESAESDLLPPDGPLPEVSTPAETDATEADLSAPAETNQAESAATKSGESPAVAEEN